MLPDLNLVLEQLRSGDGGLSQSEIERYGASFLRFKDPDGPEMHKDLIMSSILLEFWSLLLASHSSSLVPFYCCVLLLLAIRCP